MIDPERRTRRPRHDEEGVTRWEFLKYLVGLGALLSTSGLAYKLSELFEQDTSSKKLKEVLGLPDDTLKARYERDRNGYHYEPLSPFLKLPFKESELRVPYRVDGGFYAGEREVDITGAWRNETIRFEVPPETRLYCPVKKAYALASYEISPLEDLQDRIMTYRGEPIGRGRGYFVRLVVLDPKPGYIVELGQMSRFAGSFKFIKPTFYKETGLVVPNDNLPLDDLLKYSMVRKVREGELLGWVGTSGTELDEYNPGEGPIPQGRSSTSWKRPGVELRVSRMNKDGTRGTAIDPSGIYGTPGAYPTEENWEPMGEPPVLWWLKGGGRLPQFVIPAN
ncbi:hypothetical protein HYU95_06120 [Candidatus Daviesbacteria bacterium]|nr:hypothetical protein [Candidatus Daviesbacteria bacterium]